MLEKLGQIDRACENYTRSGELGNSYAFDSIRSHCN